MRILVTGGGTGGHITPVLATVDALKRRDKDIDILYVGQAGSLEAKIARSVGLEFKAIQAGKFRRYGLGWRMFLDIATLGQNLADGIKVVQGTASSWGIIRKFKPDVIFCKGGYVSLPVGLAARLCGTKYVIHESDVDPGLTNRVLAKAASKIAVGFPVENYRQWPAAKLVFTGSPVRQDVVGRHRLEGLAKFKLSDKSPIVLVVGGSQGARSINDATVGALPELLKQYQLIHIAGERDVERVRSQVKRMGIIDHENYRLVSFMQEGLGLAYAAADVVVSRAGATTIAELAALAKPAILVPAGHLHDQPHNAKVLGRLGAAKVVQDDRLTPESLMLSLKQILESPEEQQLLMHAIGRFGVKDADERLADVILGAASVNHEARGDEPEDKGMSGGGGVS
jgi:UDP-N-acetylglucosamine--N-acetylmuramyl-(pentapeptide) pyrophosphoryl-undecaprenol N-acetylglucosamine transferase